jgi:hypothetical protein
MLMEVRQLAQPVPFPGLVNTMQVIESFLGSHPVLARRTKFAAWFVAVTGNQFLWFIR